MAIYLVRHGETEWTQTHRHTGSTDIPLTPGGERQAESLARRLRCVHLDAIYTSTLARAKRTAELAGYASRLTPTHLLDEYDYGEYEGLTTSEIQERRPGWDLWRDGCPGGESPQRVLNRARQFLSSEDLSRPGDRAVFAHGHLLRALAAAYLDLPVGFCRHLILRPASISVLSQEHGVAAIESWDLV